MLKISSAVAQQIILGLPTYFPPNDPEDVLTADDLASIKFEFDLRVQLEMAIENTSRTKIPEMILIEVSP